jgi:FKBP-type peptidyl-prolyl cis-trans isomerase FkpA
MRIAALVTLLALSAPAARGQEPKTEEQKTLYAIGLAMARELSVFNLTPAELEFLKKGLTDATTGKKLAVDLDAYNPKIQDLARARRQVTGEKQAAAGRTFSEKAATEKGAVKTESGLVYVSEKEGSGPNPATTDTVKVNYRGTFIDGKEFDSSYKRGQPAEFPLGKVIKCWTEGLQKMKVGGKAKLVCPPSIGYGEQGAGGAIPPNATLVFEVELLEIKK